MSKIESVCRQCCNKFFYTKNKGAGHFCSKACYEHYKKNPIVGATNRECVICSIQFLHYQDKVVTCSSECSKKYHRITRRRSQIKAKISRKEKILTLHGNCCSKCGFSNGKRSLAFHHVDPSTKLFELTPRNMDSHSWEKVLEESAKCILLCHNCHFILHEDLKSESDKNKTKHKKYREIKTILINIKGGKCENCGLEYTNHLSIMTFHHKDRATKKFQLAGSKLAQTPLICLLEELEKCSLLCMNCHMVLEESIDLKAGYGIPP